MGELADEAASVIRAARRIVCDRWECEGRRTHKRRLRAEGHAKRDGAYGPWTTATSKRYHEVMNLVVVGLDASPAARKLLDYAVRLVQSTNGRLVLVRAVQIPMEFPAEAFSLTPGELTPVLMEQATRSLAELCSHVPPALMDHTEVEMGTPWQVVCDTAKNLSADLVVIGAHGYTVLDRVLGTTAARVVNHAHCSVLVVRDPELTSVVT